MKFLNSKLITNSKKSNDIAKNIFSDLLNDFLKDKLDSVKILNNDTDYINMYIDLRVEEIQKAFANNFDFLRKFINYCNSKDLHVSTVNDIPYRVSWYQQSKILDDFILDKSLMKQDINDYTKNLTLGRKFYILSIEKFIDKKSNDISVIINNHIEEASYDAKYEVTVDLEAVLMTCTEKCNFDSLSNWVKILIKPIAIDLESMGYKVKINKENLLISW